MIRQERVARVDKAETTWSVTIRDGNGLDRGLFSKSRSGYYETVEEAVDAAKRRVENGKADRYELSYVADREVNA